MSDDDIPVVKLQSAALIALAPEMREMLLKLEGYEAENGELRCPSCGFGWAHTMPAPIHDIDCALAVILDKLR